MRSNDSHSSKVAARPSVSDDGGFTVLEMLERQEQGKLRRANAPMPNPADLDETERTEYVEDIGVQCRNVVVDLALKTLTTPEDLRGAWGCVQFDGGGTKDGGFWLAPDQQSLLEFLRLILFYSSIGDPEYVKPSAMWRLTVAIDGWRMGVIDWDKFVWALGVAISGYGEIRWIGPVEELLTGESSFARNARQSFREDCTEDRSTDSGPLSESEIEEFLKTMLRWNELPMFGIVSLTASGSLPAWIRGVVPGSTVASSE